VTSYETATGKRSATAWLCGKAIRWRGNDVKREAKAKAQPVDLARRNWRDQALKREETVRHVGGSPGEAALGEIAAKPVKAAALCSKQPL
jgi:hypothetical protein